MRIVFSPQRSDAAKPALAVSGHVLTVNGEALDFAPLDAPGDAIDNDASGHDFVLGARNDDGTIEVTVLLPHGAEPSEAELFPEPVTVSEGAVTLP